jgi:serine/threonine protein kinase
MYEYFSEEVWNLLSGLLERDPARRISNPALIKKHPWFKTIDWKALTDKKIKPPFKPLVASPDDTRNIDQMFLRETIKETMPLMNMNSFSTKQQNHFDRFTYIAGGGPLRTSGELHHPLFPGSHNEGIPTAASLNLSNGGAVPVATTSGIEDRVEEANEEEEEEDDNHHGEMFVEIVQAT